MSQIEPILAKKKDVFLKAVACAFLLSMYFFRISGNIVDPDLWHQMALVREAVALGHIPLDDHFAYTPTIFPSVQHEWGAGVVAYFLATRFGAIGILAVKYLLALCIAVFSLLCLKRRSLTIEIVVFLAPIGVLLIDEGFSTVRAQLYSLAVFACLLWLFELDRKGNRTWIAVWIPLYLIWINIHGGFLVGFVLFGSYWLERLLRREAHRHLILVGLAMVGLIAVNPYGPHYYPYLWRAMMIPRPYVKEWQPLWIGSDLLHISLFLVSLVLVIYLVKKIGIKNAHGIVALFTSALASVFCTRLVPFYAIVWTCYLPGYLERTPVRDIVNGLWRKRRRFVILILCIASIVFLSRTLSLRPWKLLVPGDHMKRYGNHQVYPVGPVEYLREVVFKGNLMVFFDWGSYVTWKLYPDVRVSMDSRYEVVYPEWLVEESVRFYLAKEGWQRTLSKYPTDLVLVHKELPLSRAMSQQGEWKKVYTDKIFELYARPGLTLPVVDRTGRVLEGTFP